MYGLLPDSMTVGLVKRATRPMRRGRGGRGRRAPEGAWIETLIDLIHIARIIRTRLVGLGRILRERLAAEGEGR